MGEQEHMSLITSEMAINLNIHFGLNFESYLRSSVTVDFGKLFP